MKVSCFSTTDAINTTTPCTVKRFWFDSFYVCVSTINVHPVIDGRSQIKVDEWTQVHSARSPIQVLTEVDAA